MAVSKINDWVARMRGFRKVWREQPALIDYERLAELAARDAHRYATNAPFPHIVIDNFLNPAVLQQALAAFPSIDDLKWMKRDAKSATGKTAQLKKFDFALGRKHLDEELELDPLLRYLMLELNSGTFLYFLQTLTGIQKLIADPKMLGGGLHQTLPGGMLRIHADFLKHPLYAFDRRLNVLLFLNDDWRPEYGGNLELWSADMARCEREIAPIANRCVIFTTTETSYHGYTTPIACPEGRSRKSIAMYYYTMPPAAAVVSDTDWQDLPGE